MRVSWDNPDGTYVRIEDGDATHQIPTDPLHPEWQRIKAAAAAGELTIEPYQPPSPETEQS